MQILECYKGHFPAFAVSDHLETGYDAPYSYVSPVRQIAYFYGVNSRMSGKDLFVFGKRMTCNEKTDCLFFKCEPPALRPLLHIGKLRVNAAFRLGAEKGVLPDHPVFLALLPDIESIFHHMQHLRTFCAGGIKRPALYKRLHHPFIYLAQVNPLTKIMDRLKCPLFPPRGNNRLYRALAHVFYRCKPEPDVFVHHRKIPVALIYVRRQDPDPLAAAFGNIFDYIVGVPHFTRKKGRHKLDRIIRLQICGLVNDKRIRRTVRLVEAVPSKLFNQSE